MGTFVLVKQVKWGCNLSDMAASSGIALELSKNYNKCDDIPAVERDRAPARQYLYCCTSKASKAINNLPSSGIGSRALFDRCASHFTWFNSTKVLGLIYKSTNTDALFL